DFASLYQLLTRAVEATWDPNQRLEWTREAAQIAREKLRSDEQAVESWERLWRARGGAGEGSRAPARAHRAGRPLGSAGGVPGPTGRAAAVDRADRGAARGGRGLPLRRARSRGGGEDRRSDPGRAAERSGRPAPVGAGLRAAQGLAGAGRDRQAQA